MLMKKHLLTTATRSFTPTDKNVVHRQDIGPELCHRLAWTYEKGHYTINYIDKKYWRQITQLHSQRQKCSSYTRNRSKNVVHRQNIGPKL